MAALQTSGSVLLDIPLNGHRFAVPGDCYARVFVDTPTTAGISGRRQDGPKDENWANSRGSDCHRCPGCLDHTVQRGLFCSGREPVEDELARGPVLLKKSL